MKFHEQAARGNKARVTQPFRNKLYELNAWGGRTAMMLVALAGLAFCSTMVAARPITVTDLVALRRVSTVAASADGRWLVWQQSETDLIANRIANGLWVLDLKVAHAQPRRLATAENHNARDPGFSADGKWIYFIGDSSDHDELWRIATTDGAPEQVTRYGFDLTSFVLSPGGQIALVADVPSHCTVLPCRVPVKCETCSGTGRAFDRLSVRHSTAWVTPELRPRVYVMSLDGQEARSAQTMPVDDVPSQNGVVDDGERSAADIGRLAWSADSQMLFSTRETDDVLAVSPDGKWLAHAGSARPTRKSAANTLHLHDLRSGKLRPIAASLQASVASISWAADSNSLLLTGLDGLDEPLFRITLPNGTVTRLTANGHVSNVLPAADGGAIIALDTMAAPTDLYQVSPRGQLTRLTHVNGDRFADLDVPQFQHFDFTGANARHMQGWLVAPKGSGRKLPTIMLIHGEPRERLADSWSYRWNPMLFSAPGYAVVGVDVDASSDTLLEDLKSGITAAAEQFSVVDPGNACAAGGQVMNWIAGHWSEGFNCLVVHGGVFDARAMDYETDDPQPTDFYPAHSGADEAGNPVSQVSHWRSPMLVLHGENDFDVPYTQAIASFTAAQRRKLPSRLVVFPDEGHWITQPKNGIQWYGEAFGWFGKWLKRPQAGAE
jgi:dipeptidyl aminopeptidase/acylaminoacyl peptidase